MRQRTETYAGVARSITVHLISCFNASIATTKYIGVHTLLKKPVYRTHLVGGERNGRMFIGRMKKTSLAVGSELSRNFCLHAWLLAVR